MGMFKSILPAIVIDGSNSELIMNRVVIKGNKDKDTSNFVYINYKKSELLLGKYISEEANKAAAVKTEIPIYVVLGNPPYSGHSANKNIWIESLVRDYYQIDGVPLNEKNSKTNLNENLLLFNLKK